MKVVIIGCGQLGSRHAESLAKHPKVSDIVLVDPSNSSLELAKERIRGTGYSGNIRTLDAPDLVDGDFRLAVVSTSAGDRSSALNSFLQNSRADHFVLEKLLATNLDSLDEISKAAQRTQGQFWVNCPMPFFPHYESIQKDISRLNLKGPTKYSVRGGNYGLVTNFIHYLDHFYSLTGSQILKVFVDPKAQVIPSKRNGYSELLGKISASTENGDELDVEFLEAQTSEVLEIVIQNGDFFWTVDELNLTLNKNSLDGVSVRETIFTPRQSDLTHLSLLSLDLGHKPDWATLEESAQLHRKLLEGLKNHLGLDSRVQFT